MEIAAACFPELNDVTCRRFMFRMGTAARTGERMEMGSGVRIGPFEVFAPLQPATSLIRGYGEHHFPGRLIVVEGIDGSGKSTQLSLLHKWLEVEGLRRGVQRVEFVAAGERHHQVGKKKKMLTPGDVFADSLDRFCGPHRSGAFCRCCRPGLWCCATATFTRRLRGTWRAAWIASGCASCMNSR